MSRVSNRFAGALPAVVVLALGCEHPVSRETAPAAPRGAPPSGAVSAPPSPPASQAPLPPSQLAPPPAPAPRGPLHFLIIGGGPTPESNEVSLEQDVELVTKALPAPGLVLFAGGSASASVRELAPQSDGDALKLELGELVAPRAGRQSRYRSPHFSADRATLEQVEARLSSALEQGDAPLLLYIAGHGDQGSEPKNNSVALWGGRSISVARLVELHEQHQRPLRVVATSCFSGGFGELAFAHADAKAARAASVARCGLFAGTADRETSGCDPNPNRRAQESYGLHLAHALAGRRKDGSALPLERADLDHDGKIGLLEAHSWASIEAVSFDVPTTTSERWLRRVEPGSAPIDAKILPEAWAVAERLGAALGLRDEKAVERRWSELDAQLAELNAAVDTAEEALGARENEETTRLLERWPVLDDPFHPDFEATFRDERAPIEALLERSPEARARAEANQRVQTLYEQVGQVGVEEARVLRVLRAYETLHKASALLRRGGPAAKYYASLLACERGAP